MKTRIYAAPAVKGLRLITERTFKQWEPPQYCEPCDDIRSPRILPHAFLSVRAFVHMLVGLFVWKNVAAMLLENVHLLMCFRLSGDASFFTLWSVNADGMF